MYAMMVVLLIGHFSVDDFFKLLVLSRSTVVLRKQISIFNMHCD